MQPYLIASFDHVICSIRSILVSKIIVFRKFATELRALIDVRIWFLLNSLRKNKQIETKFCIHIIIDKIYVDIVNLCFSQICNRVTALD